MASAFSITINGWDDHQERANRKNYTWFKFYSKAVEGHLWMSTTHEEKTVWIYLLCQRNRQGCVTIHTTDAIVAAVCDVRPNRVSEILSRLADLGAITAEGGMNTAQSRRNDGAMYTPEREEKRREEGETAATPLTPAWLLECWNENAGSLSKPRGLDAGRRKNATARLKEHPNCEDWINAIRRVAASSKCLGFENEPGKYQNWKADFDWLIKPGRLNQILEGKWDGRASSQARRTPFQADLERELEERKTGGVA